MYLRNKDNKDCHYAYLKIAQRLSKLNPRHRVTNKNNRVIVTPLSKRL